MGAHANLTVTRRRVVFGMATAIGVLASCRKLTADAAGNRTRPWLGQQVELNANPHRIYAVLLDAHQFSAFTGAPARVEPTAGAPFSLFGGLIEGRNIELVTDKRIVQAWRPTSWQPGDYSIVRFDLKLNGPGTTVSLTHKGFPEGDFEHLNEGWHEHYWEPLKKFLG